MSRARDFADLASAYSQDALGTRNLLLNGNMDVYQRGSAVITGNVGKYALDRWQFYQYGGGHATVTQDTEVPTGQGFLNSLKIDVTQAESSMSAGDLYILRQRVEGQFCQRTCKGTANAKPLTLQFWVRSPKTGIHTVQIWDESNATRHVSKAYTIASADTWQYVTVTFPADTSGGAFSDDNQPALQLQFWLGGGSTYTGGSSLGETWGSTANERAVGQVNVMDNTSNNFYITGIQLECGEVATPFEHILYPDNLRLCQRYYYVHSEGNDEPLGTGVAEGATLISWYIYPPVTMRADPSVAENEGTNYYISYGGGATDQFDGIKQADTSTKAVYCYADPDNNVSGNTAGRGVVVTSHNASSKVALDAEI